MSSNPYIIRKGQGADPASNALSEALNKWFSEYGPNDIFRTCGNCKNMVQEVNQPAFCTLHKAVPPVDVIMRGCDSHEDELDTPF